jgi:branched-chain amino acid transport system substrate-binding protein
MRRKRFFFGSVSLLMFLIITLIFVPQCQKQKVEEKINVLAILTLTGPVASVGEDLKIGFEMFREDFPDSNISITYVDSQSNPKTAVSALSQTILTNRPSIIVSAFSNVSGAVIPKAETEGLFTIVTATSSDKILEGHKNVQRINPSVRDVIGTISSYAKPRFSKVAVLYSNEEWGLSAIDVFKVRFTGEGRSIIFSEAYELGQKEVRTLVQKTISENPEAIFVFGYGAAVAIFKTIREMGYKGQVVGGVQLIIPAVRNAVGEAAEGIVFAGTDTELSSPRNEKTRKLVERYTQKYKREASYPVAFAYDILSLINKLSEENLPFSQESFQSLKEWDGIATKIEFLPKGECKTKLFTMVKKNGQIVPTE